MAGGKYDFTAKWASPAMWAQMVKHFQGRVLFAQCGEAGHWHPRIPGTLDLVGKTGIRDFIRLIYHADAVASGVTFAMHLAAAVPCRPGRPPLRPCVVVAGGREPSHWEAYPGHAFLDTIGRPSERPGVRLRRRIATSGRPIGVVYAMGRSLIFGDARIR